MNSIETLVKILVLFFICKEFFLIINFFRLKKKESNHIVIKDKKLFNDIKSFLEEVAR